MKEHRYWLIWLVLVVATFVAVSSCADPAQELSTYWDSHDFRSLDSFDDIDAAEDKFYAYVDLLNAVPHEVAVPQMNVFLDSAALNHVAYMVWSGWFEAGLHYMDSPYRNDALFGNFIDKMLEDKILEDYMLEYYSEMKSLLAKNGVGSFPEDLRLADRDGNEFRPADFRGRKTLLLFLDADCPSCFDKLEENAGLFNFKDICLLAVLVNGSPRHIDNIRTRLTDTVIGKWTFLWCPDGMDKVADSYDLTHLPFRILLSPEGVIEKSYH